GCFRGRPAGNGDADVQDELLFHFRSLVEGKQAEGLAFDEAWQAAERQFGSVGHYADECRAIRLSDPGTLAPAGRLALALLAGLVGGWVGEIRGLKDRPWSLAAPESAPEGNAATPVGGGKKNDVTGVIVDSDGRPVADARILAILKTWPNNRYQQQAL